MWFTTIFITLMAIESIRLVILSHSSDLMLYECEVYGFLATMGLYFFFGILELFINKHKKDKLGYVIHHGIGLLSIIIAVNHSATAITYVLRYLTYEVSTPFLNLSIYCKEKGIKNKWSLTINLLFLITYTVSRIMYGSYLTYETTTYVLSLSGWWKLLIILPVAFQSVIYFWYFKILRITKRILC